jgi:hypothetical protein
MMNFCCVQSDPATEYLSASLIVEATRLLTVIFRNNRQKLGSRKWNFEDKVLSVSH